MADALVALPKKSLSVALLLADLGVTKSHSRPHVSNDNPYSESHFKALKYRSDFPERFGRNGLDRLRKPGVSWGISSGGITRAWNWIDTFSLPVLECQKTMWSAFAIHPAVIHPSSKR
jgi:hypothetical protein